jgi:fucose permease
VGTIGLGFFMAAFFPTTITFAGQRMRINGKVSGWFFVGSGFGGMIIPWMIGQLFESVGPSIAITLIFIDLLAALMVLFVLLANPHQAAGSIVSVPEGD